MKHLNHYINEKLKINSKTEMLITPKDKYELRRIIEERLEKNKNADFNDIDVSELYDMNYLFQNLDPHNIDISKWDVSNVTHMEFMFDGCENFNCDLSKWDVSSVTKMQYMFRNCKKFNCDLSNWNVYKMKHDFQLFYACFSGCTSLKKPDWYYYS